MSRFAALLVAGLAFAWLTAGDIETADAGYRQYYSSWTHYPQKTYYARKYYYQPRPAVKTYSYHYCVHYPSRPRYVYYYNPHTKAYWGRFDTQGKEGAQYSLLAEKDRKENLSDIPESAFPTPGQMPVIPDSEDGVRIEPPKDLPGDAAGKAADLP